VPVGIQGCAEVFLEEDGLCHPTMEKCADPATFAVPQKGCVPIDGPEGCGSGTWGNIQEEPGGTTIWVNPSVAASGAGSKANPMKTIAEALAAVPTGGRIALGTGTYDEHIRLTKAVTIEGRCPSMVRVQGEGIAYSYPVVVWVDGADDVTLRNLEIGGGGIGVIAVGANRLEIEWVRVRSATTVGLAFFGWTHASIARTLIDSTLADSDGLFGQGVQAGDRARVTFVESAIVANRDLGVLAVGIGTGVSLTDSLIEGTLPREADGQLGRGASAQDAARLTFADSALVKNHVEGAVALTPATKLTLTNSLVEGTLPAESEEQSGAGVAGGAGAELTLLGTAVLGNHGLGVLARDSGTEATVIGSLVEGTLPQQSDGMDGRGVAAFNEATLTLGDSAIVDNHDVGLLVQGTKTKVTATGALIERQGDTGISVELGGTLTLDRSAVVANFDLGIAAIQVNTRLTMTDSLVAGTLTRPGNLASVAGMAIDLGAQATLAANAIIANRGGGLSVQAPGTVVMATGNLIGGNLPQESDSLFGHGVGVSVGGTLELENNAIVENHQAGLFSHGDGSVLTAVRNLVEGTLPRQSDKRFGQGVAVSFNTRATFEGNAIVANHDVGLFVDRAFATATGNLVEGTLPQESDGQFGVGVVSSNLSRLQLASSFLHNNRVSALQVAAGATASVSHCLITSVLPGKFSFTDDPLQVFDDVADGLLATHGSSLDITDTRVHGCARAGVLFNDSVGTLSGVVSTGNQFGLVLQGDRRPDYQSEQNQFNDNTAQEVVTGGDLTVPDTPSPVPPPP